MYVFFFLRFFPLFSCKIADKFEQNSTSFPGNPMEQQTEIDRSRVALAIIQLVEEFIIFQNRYSIMAPYYYASEPMKFT